MEFAIGILPVYRNQIPPVGPLKKMLMVNGPSWCPKNTGLLPCKALPGPLRAM